MSIQELPNSSFVSLGTTQSFGAGSNDIYLINTSFNDIPMDVEESEFDLDPLVSFFIIIVVGLFLISMKLLRNKTRDN